MQRQLRPNLCAHVFTRMHNYGITQYNNSVGHIWKETVVACFNYHNVNLERLNKSTEAESEQTVSRQTFEQGTLQCEAYTTNTYTTPRRLLICGLTVVLIVTCVKYFIIKKQN
jgi:hypothetical protein